jgi:flagellar protein FliJ
MARYQFRLQTLRRLREIARDELRVRLAEAYQAERILAEERAALDAERAGLSDLQRRLVGEGVFDVNRVLGVQRYQLVLEAQGRTLGEQAARLVEEVERRHVAVIDADREVRVLDKLRERGERQHRLAAERAEAKRLDEIGTSRWEATPWAS